MANGNSVTLVGNLTRDPELIEPWLTDWRGRYTGRALALASPSSTVAPPIFAATWFMSV